MAVFDPPPYFLTGVGLAMAVLCGLTFARLIQDRLEGWKQDRHSMLPLAAGPTVMSYTGILIGVSLFIGGALQVFGFAAGAAWSVSSLLSLLTGGALWVQLQRLMVQVESGTFQAVDFDNFDQFF
ncbi:hypothetical protein EVJ50_01575 [Synechococcus sp. RSCCF101]|nr:hypothetical protein [Synechococcus sp. RSCCF101]QEY33290.1 hypothetical protein EVJ50_01575 [Synechococcus sp. RSCCF101]